MAVTLDDALKNGKVIKVIERTLTADEFKVKCLYKETTFEAILTRQ